jgi:hypothetical protein
MTGRARVGEALAPIGLTVRERRPCCGSRAWRRLTQQELIEQLDIDPSNLVTMGRT